MRRRRVRHSSSRNASIDAEHLRAFQNKYHLGDIGNMEQVTFIQDTGKITSYDKVPVHANNKSHIFNFDLSKYKHNKLHRNKSKQGKPCCIILSKSSHE